MNEPLKHFLERKGLSASKYDWQIELARFHQAMDDGLSRTHGPIAMLPTYVGVPEKLLPDTQVLVIDLGGTNLRAGLVRFDAEGKAEILDFKKRKMPGVDHLVGKDEVFDAIATMTADLIDRSQCVGFCFSNPFEILENGDARVLHFGKELKVEGMVGCLIVENLKAAWERTGHRFHGSVTVLNDTVSTLLMGKILHPGRKAGGYAGFILGTGMNISYVERNERITKVKGLKAGLSQVVNTECGDYNLFERSVFDEILDAGTRNQGRYFSEKMVSGAFIGRLVAIIIQEAHGEGLLPSPIDAQLTTKHVNDYLIDRHDSENPLVSYDAQYPQCRASLFQIIDVVLERAARLVAIQLVAVILREEVTDNFDAPVLIAIDGSSYSGEYFYRERIENYLWQQLTVARNIRFQIVRPENASLLGASVAALGSQFA